MSVSPVRRGRVPTISEDSIARAVLHIGLADVTVRNVAEYLDVSLPGLYHHVSGRDDLLRIGSQRLLESATLPDPSGLDWSEWLRRVCRSLRALMADNPEFVGQYATGAIPVSVNIVRIEQALHVLRDAGFTLEGALDALHTIGQLAIGAATEDLREAGYTSRGQPSVAQLHAALALEPDAFPLLRSLLQRFGTEPRDRFEHRLDIAIAGIAAVNGIAVE